MSRTKAYAMRTRERGLTIHTQENPFYHTLLSLVKTFIAVLKAFAMTILLSLQSFTVLSLYGIKDSIFKNFPVRNGEGGSDW